MLYRFLTAFTAFVLLSSVVSCGSKNEDNLAQNLLLMAGLTSVSQTSADATRSHDALVSVPAILTSSSAAAASASDGYFARTLIEDTDTAKGVLGIYEPVRNSVKVAADLIDAAGKFMTAVEELAAEYPQALENAYAYQDDSDTAHPGRVLKVSESTTFGTTGKKLEIWCSATPETSLCAGKKILELDYYKNTATNEINGILRFKMLNEEQTALVTVRTEFSKKSDANGFVRKALVHVQNYKDFNSNPANAGFLLTENSDGSVSVDGAYTIRGLKQPFVEANTDPDWQTDDDRVYLFTASGSDKTNKAVISVILPLKGATIDGTESYKNAQADISLGEIYTTGFIKSLNDSTDLTGDWAFCTDSAGINLVTGTNTRLQCFNLLTDWIHDSDLNNDSVADLTGSSTGSSVQSDLNTILDIYKNSSNQDFQSFAVQLGTITGLKNPVYIIKNSTGYQLIGQENTDGLSAVIGDSGVTEMNTLQTMLRSTVRTGTDEGGDFSPSSAAGIFALNIEAGTAIQSLTEHSTITDLEIWTGAADPVPTAQN